MVSFPKKRDNHDKKRSSIGLSPNSSKLSSPYNKIATAPYRNSLRRSSGHSWNAAFWPTVSFPFTVTHADTIALWAFSCKGRVWCPGCGGRRMADTAAHLVDHVFPVAPVRQWVLSSPFALQDGI